MPLYSKEIAAFKNLSRQKQVEHVGDLAASYYQSRGNEKGGNLNAVLHQGLLDDITISVCMKEAESLEDTRGVELAKLIMLLDNHQREDLYYNK